MMTAVRIVGSTTMCLAALSVTQSVPMHLLECAAVAWGLKVTELYRYTFVYKKFKTRC
jgi:hypothetical protein